MSYLSIVFFFKLAKLFRGYFIGAPGRDLGARSENEADDSIIIQQAVREAATICPAPAS